jgi:hypothetical protein
MGELTATGISWCHCWHTGRVVAHVLLVQISTLVLCEHKAGVLAGATLNSVTAAVQLAGQGGEVTALVTGGTPDAEAAAGQASRVGGVSHVLVAQHEALRHQQAEPLAALVRAVQARCVFIGGMREFAKQTECTYACCSYAYHSKIIVCLHMHLQQESLSLFLLFSVCAI